MAQKADWTGRRILFLGSSVTYGSAAGGISVADLLAEETGCQAVKEAVSGTTLVDDGGDSYVSRMKNMDAHLSADLFVCQLSTNDASQGKPLGIPQGPGGAFDVHTVAGAMEWIVEAARKTWHCPVAFYSNPRYDSQNYARMVELMHRICALWKAECIDLWNDDAVNGISQAQRRKWMADEIHPTEAGYRQWWLPVFQNEIERILESETQNGDV